MSVSLSGGPTGANISGPTSVKFSGGVAEFDGLMIDKAGSGYSLTFSISHGSQGHQISPLTLALPAVGTRPLAFKLTSKPKLEKQAETFSIPLIASLWDVANDVKADPSLATAVNCEISLVTQNATLSGTLMVSMDTSKIVPE